MDLRTNSIILWAALVLCGFLACLQQSQPRSVNEASRLALAESLLVRGETFVNRSPFFNTVDQVERGRLHYSDKPPIVSLYTATVLRPLVPAFSFTDPFGSGVLHRAAVLSLNGLFLALLIIIWTRTGAAAGVPAASTLRAGHQLLLGTLVLGFLSAFTTHIAEASLTLCAVCALVADHARPRLRYAALAGLCAGLQWNIHPMSGTLLVAAAGLAFLLGGFRRAAVFAAAAAAVAGAGLWMHFELYGTWKFFYFEPAHYYFRYGPGWTQLSTQFYEPFMMPGLNETVITERVKQLGLGDKELTMALESFRQLQARTADPIAYAVAQFKTYGFLALNPLAAAAAGVWIRGAVRDGRRFWRLHVCIALLWAGFTAALIAVRSNPGTSFGNRYLIPCIAALIVGCWASSERDRFRPLLGLMFTISLPMMLPGLVRPWERPEPLFLSVNGALALVLYAVTALWLTVPKAEAVLRASWERFDRAVWPSILALWGLAVAEMMLFKPLRPVEAGECLIPAAILAIVSVVRICSQKPDMKNVLY